MTNTFIIRAASAVVANSGGLESGANWYGYDDGMWYVGPVSTVDGKLFASPGTNTGPFKTKKAAKAYLGTMKKSNARGWAYAKVFQVKDKAITLSN